MRAHLIVGLAAVVGCSAAGESDAPMPSDGEAGGSTGMPGVVGGSTEEGSNATGAADDGTTTTGVGDTAAASEDEGDGGPVMFDVGGVEATTDGGVADPCTAGDATTLPATVRDFASSHVDFEVFWGSEPTTGLVLPTLGGDQTPSHNPTPPAAPAGSSATQITSAASFDDWYHDADGVNVATEVDIELVETPPGSGNYVFDDPTFFPIDDDGWNAMVGPNNETFPDSLGDQHNFHFTTEIHTTFIYAPGQVFTFIGDDDLWVFIDGQLAIDLGGLHGEVEGTVDLSTLGLTPGDTYAMDIFHAERRHDGSHFRVETSIDCFLPPAG